MVNEMELALNARHVLERAGGRDVFSRARKFTLAAQLRKMGMLPYYRPLECNEGPVARIEGRAVLMLGSNNYLGLTTDPRVRQASADAVLKYGTSLTGSRPLNGSIGLHQELETELADFVGKPSALVFATGYQANVGALTALLNQQGVAVLDRFDHASIHDGARTSGAEIVKYPHNDFEELERVLSGLDTDKGALVVVDGVFSMEGDIARLPELVELCRRCSARLMVDDAHGIGVMGPGGRGTPAHFGVQDGVDVIVGTFSKALASVGGFVAAEEQVIDYVRFFGRSMVFSASLPPASTAAALAALRVLKAEPERVERLHRNAVRWREGLAAAGFEIGASESPIVPIVVGNEFTTLGLWKALIEQGLYVNAVVHPAVPRDRALLRTSVMATHEDAHIDAALEILTAVGRKFGICQRAEHV